MEFSIIMSNIILDIVNIIEVSAELEYCLVLRIFTIRGIFFRDKVLQEMYYRILS